MVDILDGEHFDAVVIGAGMSGMAAAIRLAMYDKKVILLERHNAAGGLNSFYSIGGRKYDVGLHALTNYVPSGVKGTALGKLLRQLRISRDEWGLHEQKSSRVVFSGRELRFSNDLDLLREEVQRLFPKEVDGLNRFIQTVPSYDAISMVEEEVSAFDILRTYIKNEDLVQMLMLPVMYYGNAREHDMDWSQFAILFRSIFLEGLARPYDGVRQIIRTLLNRYRSLGGKRKMKCGVRKIEAWGNKIQSLELDDGTRICADHVVSTIGIQETMGLCCQDVLSLTPKNNVGKLSFVETISVFKDQPFLWGWEDTTVFYNLAQTLHYESPSEAVDLRSGVICIPNNYNYTPQCPLQEGQLRITALASYDRWASLEEAAYKQQKAYWFCRLRDQALTLLGTPEKLRFTESVVAEDMFTPRTIKKYTGHIAGAVYGAPNKLRSGKTSLENLYIAGTDQGLLGVMGALLSGVTIANRYILAS